MITQSRSFRLFRTLIRVRTVCVLLTLCGITALLACSANAADNWIDISSSLVERLTSDGAKAAWPGGCSGVVVNRTNGNVTIKVVGLGLWRSSNKGSNLAAN